jgi:hypothetical protein
VKLGRVRAVTLRGRAIVSIIKKSSETPGSVRSYMLWSLVNLRVALLV